MLWSDPADEPSEEARDAEAMLRRAGKVLAIAMIILVFALF
ncbi:morphogenic membrane protein MmpB [Streptomyces sp. KR80]